MSLKFRGDYEKLKKCIIQTEIDGNWRKLTNGQRQFVADDGGVLNWAASTGRVWFQGGKEPSRKLECAFIAVASKRGRLESELKGVRVNLDDDNEVLKRLLADALLDNAKLKRRVADLQRDL